MSYESRGVRITGGTFFFAFWLFWAAMCLGGIHEDLKKIGDTLGRAFPPPAEEMAPAFETPEILKQLVKPLEGDAE